MVLGRGCEIRVRHLVFKGSNGVIYGVRSLLVFIFYSYKKKIYMEWAYGNTFREGGIVLCILHILM